MRFHKGQAEPGEVMCACRSAASTLIQTHMKTFVPL